MLWQGMDGAIDDKQIVTVDIVLLTHHEGRLTAGLVRREASPFEDRLALIGGYVHADEDDTAELTAVRVLRQKTGLKGFFIEQLGAFTGRNRDPRGWSVSVAYLALIPYSRLRDGLSAGTVRLELTPADGVHDLPFDHDKIFRAAVERLHGRRGYSPLPVRLIDEPFTLNELQRVFESVPGAARVDKRAFQKKLEGMDLVVPAVGRRTDTDGRQAPLYRRKGGAVALD
jgi:8-oxo-dGTP diphosphatase